MDAREIVERIMAQHWDMAACNCWVCVEGDKLGFHRWDRYLPHKQSPADRYKFTPVHVERRTTMHRAETLERTLEEAEELAGEAM